MKLADIFKPIVRKVLHHGEDPDTLNQLGDMTAKSFQSRWKYRKNHGRKLKQIFMDDLGPDLKYKPKKKEAKKEERKGGIFWSSKDAY